MLTALDLVACRTACRHRPGQLSGGQQQRVGIARAIVTDPTLIVADEPTGDLDAKSADEILDLLVELQKGLRKTIIMVTHDPRAAARAERVLHLDKGRLVRETSPRDPTAPTSTASIMETSSSSPGAKRGGSAAMKTLYDHGHGISRQPNPVRLHRRVVLAVLAVARTASRRSFYARFIAKSLRRNVLQPADGLAIIVLVLVVTLVWTVLSILDLVTEEKSKDLKAIVTESWQIPSQMPYAYETSLLAAVARSQGRRRRSGRLDDLAVLRRHHRPGQADAREHRFLLRHGPGQADADRARQQGRPETQRPGQHRLRAR